MSVGISSGSGGQVLGASTTAASGVALLPFTHGNTLGIYVAITAITCGVVILLSKAVKRFAKNIG